MRRSVLAALALLGAAPDAHLLATGSFEYQAVSQGREIGRSHISITGLEGGRYRFAASITGEGDQQWESVASGAFSPVSASIRFAQDPPTFALDYHGGRVTGFVIARHGPTRGTRRTVDDTVPAGVVDQRIDWASVMARQLVPGERFEFTVYDPSIGISRAEARVGGLEHVQVPAGAFDVYRITYQIAKATGAETYQVLATREVPRRMVREEFSDGVRVDLVSTTP